LPLLPLTKTYHPEVGLGNGIDGGKSVQKKSNICLVDTHAHIEMAEFDNDRNKVIMRAEQEGICALINVGADLKSSRLSVALADSVGMIYAAVGIHPHTAVEANERVYEEITELSRNRKVVAIGEIGLDYHYNFSPRNVQQTVFREQIRMAKNLNLPVIIHNRESDEDMIRILKEENIADIGGVMHCFAGSTELAKTCLDMGLYIAVGGLLTFQKAENIRRIVKELPLSCLLVETDSPYMAPHPLRGKRCEPAFVKWTAKELASLKGISPEELSRITTENAKKLFGFAID
jgi:TatD DNase family protein